ncbi:MAG: hypothetical protein IAF02_07330 [Anaerolineae bacterium]|nr:hypothetical protein [Anaerolineae bacterium]
MNTDTDTVIPGYETMPDGITLDLTLLPTENLNIAATLNPQYAHHVDVTLTGTATRSHTEYYYPYTFPGNDLFDYHPYNFVPGSYTLTFEPYIDATTPGTTFILNFTVIRSVIPTDTPVPTDTPDPTVVSVVPSVCVVDGGGGWYVANFGYRNDNGFAVNIPVGPNNTFVPDPPHLGQPSTFNPGAYTNVVTTNFQDPNSVSWQLDGNIATADSSSPTCP